MSEVTHHMRTESSLIPIGACANHQTPTANGNFKHHSFRIAVVQTLSALNCVCDVVTLWFTIPNWEWRAEDLDIEVASYGYRRKGRLERNGAVAGLECSSQRAQPG